MWHGRHHKPTRLNSRSPLTLVHEVVMAPPREPYGSLDEMLSPKALSRLEGRTVTRVRRRSFTAPYGGVSGNRFLAVDTLADGGQRRSYIVKRTSSAWDIIMRITDDSVCRELQIWRSGLLDQLPPEVG